MSVKDILREIDVLPAEDKWQVLEHVRHSLEPEIPESFREGMEDIKRGNTIDLDEALKELDQP